MDFLSELFRHPLISLSLLAGLITLQCALMRSLAPVKAAVYTLVAGGALFGLVFGALSNSWLILAALPTAAVVCVIIYLTLSLNFHFKRDPQGKWGDISRKHRIWLASGGGVLIFCALFGLWIIMITTEPYLF